MTTSHATKRTPVPTPTGADTTIPLEALVGDLPAGPRLVDVNRLVDHPKNPRQHMDPDDLAALADSIRAQGVRQNLLVVPDPGEEGRHLIVIGHRRAAAARLVGLTEVPAMVDPTLTEAQQLALMLAENMQRSDLTVVEEADGFQGLLDLGMTRAQIVKETGVLKTKLSDRLKVRSLPQAARDSLSAGTASLTDALKLTEFSGHPDIENELAAKLGTRDFQWAYESATQRKANREGYVAIAAQLTEQGFTILPAGESPETDKWIWNGQASAPTTLARITENGFTPDETMLAPIFGDWFQIWRRRSQDEPDGGPVEPAESESVRAARLARERQLAEAKEGLVAAVAARHAFLRPLTRGERKLTKAQADTAARFVARSLIDSMDQEPDVLYVGEWLFESGTAPGEGDPDYCVLAANVSTARAWLAVAASFNEGAPNPVTSFTWQFPARVVNLVSPEAWSDSEDLESRQVTAWYAFLAELGYVPSSWEIARLAGEPFPEADVTGDVS